MLRLFLLTGIVLFSLDTMHAQTSEELSSQKVVIDSIEMLYGKITEQQLYHDYPDWKIERTYYEVDSELVDKIRETNWDNIQILIFQATWCGDSEREVPRFFKILDEANIRRKVAVTMYALDRQLELENGLANDYNIQRVPTFIFLKDGEELDRIVERPDASMEKDIYAIVNGH